VPFRTEDEGGLRQFVLEACPIDDQEDSPPYTCRVTVRADGSFAVHCEHDAAARWRDFKSLVGWAQHARSVMKELGVAPPPAAPYRATDAGLFLLQRVGKRVAKLQLTNFCARITRDIAEDDGLEVRHQFEIEASLAGKVTRFTLPPAEFASGNWPLQYLGAGAVVFAAGTKGHLRTAVQLASAAALTERIYPHTGWREHERRFVYLHGGGAIGQDGPVPGVRVALPDALTGLRLPEPPSGEALAAAVRTSLGFLDVGPDRLTIPMYGLIWRVAVGGVDFSAHLAGPSGTGKTELAALAQQHQGAELDSRHLPASWLSTPGANELLAFHAKDALLVIDDFVPGAGLSEARQHREADRVLRGQGNSAGRGRLAPGPALHAPRPPRGGILSTGEAIPRGQSLQARILVLDVSAGDLNWEQLTGAQHAAAEGRYAAAFAGFVRWLAPRLDAVRRTLPERLAALREQATASGLHKRVPAIVANLYLGLQLFAEFAVAAGALSGAEAEAFLQRSWQALGAAAAAQAALQAHGEPARRFLELLRAAVAAGQAHVAGPDGGAPDRPAERGWRPDGDGWAAAGDRIGWLDGPDLYLDPEAALAVAQWLAQERHEPLGVAARSLHKRLAEQGHLVSRDTTRDRLVVRRSLEGSVRAVLHVRADVLGTAAAAGPPPAGAGTAAGAPGMP
jgi:hypothetical protein